jgi:L-threonine-O-3-phosphate decarboxylase
VTSLDIYHRGSTKRGMSPEPRREVLGLTPAVHGSLDVAEMQRIRLRPDEVLDFSANVNPYAPSLAVRDVLASVPLGQYPDRGCVALKDTLAESLGLTSRRILPGNGASELIWLAALAFVRPGSRVLILGPTFCEYARVAELMGAHVSSWEAREDVGFALEPAEITSCLESSQPQVVFLCNPNNPTGAILSADVIAEWARSHPWTLFVVDEAYLPFAPDCPSALALARENVLVLRSMTKDFGLAGLRLGYAVGDERVIDPLSRVQPPWSVNALAQAAGVAVLRDSSYRERSLVQVNQTKASLTRELARLGLAPVESATHFFLVRVGDGGTFRQALLRRGILVRDCASFGLPAYVRIATRCPEENAQLLAAVREALS